MSKHFIFTFTIFSAILSVLLTVTASAQFDFAQNEPDGTRYIGGPRLGESQTQIWRAGIILEPQAAMENVQINIPVPMNWWEQRIVNVNEEKMDADLASQIQYQIINGGAMEMRLQLGNVRPAKPLEIVVAFEVLNYELLPPDNPDQYVIPKRMTQEIKQYLQESPCIESRDPRFAKMFAEITKERRTDWDKVEALYSFVQNNVKYDEQGWQRQAKGALAVTKMPRGEWSGDCKDMSCLFVALCRAGKVPARIVRVPGHCYAEFYLELKQNKQTSNNNNKTLGFWFPCQVSGTYAFGGIPEKRIILQKGDSFPDPGNAKIQILFTRECLRGSQETGTPGPRYQWVHDAVVK